MHCPKSHFPHLFGLLILLLVPKIDTDLNILAELGNGTHQRSQDMASDPMGLIESIGSPGNLMNSVLDEVRNTNPSASHGETDSYAEGQNLILSHQIIPAKDFIHLYSTYPFAIAEGSVIAKLPCNSDSSTPLRIMIGQIPRLQPANLSIERDLSKPGYMCLYNSRILQNSTSDRNMSAITDIVLFNTSEERTVLPNTSTFVVGVIKLYPLQNGTMQGRSN